MAPVRVWSVTQLTAVGLVLLGLLGRGDVVRAGADAEKPGAASSSASGPSGQVAPAKKCYWYENRDRREIGADPACDEMDLLLNDIQKFEWLKFLKNYWLI